MGPSDKQAPGGANNDPSEGDATRLRPGPPRRSRSRQDEHRIALRKAKVFASRGQDHLAEAQINQALGLGASLQDVADALDDLSPRHEVFSRREAIKRAVALLGAGLLGGSVIDVLGADPGPALAAGPATPKRPTGVFLTLPSDSTTNPEEGYHVAALGSTGVTTMSGPYRGDTIAADNRLYNIAQSWGDGAASTRVTVITTTRPSASFSLPGAGRTNGASTVESATTATVRGSFLYCCHTWRRIFGGSESQVGPNIGPIRFTAQPVLEAVDLETRTLVDRWIGGEVAGACRPALKVSGDGAAAMIALDMPGVPPAVPRVMLFDFDGEHLSAISAVTPTPQTRAGLGSSFYQWPHPGSPLVHVAFDGVHRYSAGHSDETFCALPVEYANNRHPPALQGTFGPDGLAVASSGDGWIFHNRPDAAGTYSASTFPRQTERPPYLAYQGSRLRRVFQTAGSRTWVVDNREGVGGIWQLGPGFEPVDHLLAGSYVSDVSVDASGTYLMAQSDLDSAIYAIDPDGATMAFRAPPRANLVRRN